MDLEKNDLQYTDAGKLRWLFRMVSSSLTAMRQCYGEFCSRIRPLDRINALENEDEDESCYILVLENRMLNPATVSSALHVPSSGLDSINIAASSYLLQQDDVSFGGSGTNSLTNGTTIPTTEHQPTHNDSIQQTTIDSTTQWYGTDLGKDTEDGHDHCCSDCFRSHDKQTDYENNSNRCITKESCCQTLGAGMGGKDSFTSFFQLMATNPQTKLYHQCQIEVSPPSVSRSRCRRRRHDHAEGGKQSVTESSNIWILYSLWISTISFALKYARGVWVLTMMIWWKTCCVTVFFSNVVPPHSVVAAFSPVPILVKSALSIVIQQQHQMSGHPHGSTSSFSLAATESIRDSSNRQNFDGLSKSLQSILRHTNNERQRFVTGQYPVIITLQDNPTLKWLRLGKKTKDISTTMVLINGTSIDRSLASYDRYQWLEEHERNELHSQSATVSMELLAEINLPRPGYLQILSGDGAGSSAAILKSHTGVDGTTKWNRWKHDTLYHERRALDRQKAPLRDRLWVTGFSMTSRNGWIKSVDIHDGRIDSINPRSASMILWPNEVNTVPRNVIEMGTSSKDPRRHITQSRATGIISPQDALLVSDGFLVPGKDRGGIYIIKNPGNENLEWRVCLTNPFLKDQWFYHRAIWVDLTGDGRKSILTARAKLRKVSNDVTGTAVKTVSDQRTVTARPKNGQLVWLEMPQPHHFDADTGTPLEADGTVFDPFSGRHLPWQERVLATGPDVMFAVADMNPTDDTIEVIASRFFDKKVSLHSIKIGQKPQVCFCREIDNQCGAAFGGILADLDPLHSAILPQRVVDSGSTVNVLKPGDSFTHFLVSSHECNYDVEAISQVRSLSSEIDSRVLERKVRSRSNFKSLKGGSIFAYRVPTGKDDAWKHEPWQKTKVATGFQVKSQIWNVINPGAPGFCYTFYANKNDKQQDKRPMLAVAGDCAESAFLFRPLMDSSPIVDGTIDLRLDQGAQYKLMCEVKCEATVGSIAIGYGDLCSVEQESGYAKIYIPCFEKDKILVFALGNGDNFASDVGW